MHQLSLFDDIRACVKCGRQFVQRSRRRPQKFCSEACRFDTRRSQRNAWRRLDREKPTCWVCGAELPQQLGKGRKARFCRARCRLDHIAARKRARRVAGGSRNL